MAFTYVSLRVGGGLRLPDGMALSGWVRLTPTADMTNGVTLVARPVTEPISDDGTVTKRFAANTDPATGPAGVAYLIEIGTRGELAPRRRFYAQLRHDAPGGVIDLDTLDELAPPPVLEAVPRRISSALDYDNTTAPQAGQAIVWNGTKWAPAAVSGGGGSVADATTSTKGVARILGGTADSPTVPWTAVTGKPTIPDSPDDIGAQPAGSYATVADLSTHNADTTSVHGIADTTLLATTGAITSAVAAHEADTTNVHGIADTSALATTSALTSGLAGKAATSHTHPVTDLTATGTRSSSTFLRGDNTWATPASGSGTVISVTAADGTITVAGTATDPTIAVGTGIAQSKVTNLVSDLAGKQPLDSDLTTIAGLTATTDSILQAKASAWTTRTPAQLKTDLALTKSDVGLSNVTNNAQVTGVTAGDATITIGGTSTAPTVAVTGSTFQPIDPDLTTIAGLTATTDNFLQAKSSAWASRTPTQVAADLVTPLSSSLQPLDSDLTAIAALSPSNDDVIQRKAGVWTNRTLAQVRYDLLTSTTLPTPLIDLDPDQVSGSNGAAVTTLPDTSGSARDFTQSNASFKPVLVTAGPNGHKALTFDGAYMQNTTTGISGQTALTICMVLSGIGVPANAANGLLSAATTSDFTQTTGEFYIAHPVSTSETTFTSLQVGGSVVGTNDQRVVYSSRAFGTYVILTVEIGCDGLPARAYINGQRELDITGRSVTSLLTSAMYLGARVLSAGSPATTRLARFTLARMRFYSGRLGPRQRDALETAMASTYGITLA